MSTNATWANASGLLSSKQADRADTAIHPLRSPPRLAISQQTGSDNSQLTNDASEIDSKRGADVLQLDHIQAPFAAFVLAHE
ncbi:hypothetical protein GA0061091_12713 [Gordonia sp. v-85]|nr:hypothetical protein GA0061091_12713 [Gordonia sp. v-85]